MNPIRKPEVRAIISIEGERVGCKYLKISQEMGEHHDFEVLLDHRTFDAAFYKDPERNLSLIQAKIVIDLQHGDDNSKAYVFSGMIEQVKMVAEDGMHGGVLLTGKSNTIELERGEMCQTYSNTNLQTIFREITSGTVNLNTEILPDWKSDIDFAIQYKESDWDFLVRTCSQYQEKFYYTGTDLIIGSHPEFKTVELHYDEELTTFEMCSRLLPNEFSTYRYLRENHTLLQSDSPGEVEGSNFYMDQMQYRSDRLTKRRRPNTPADAYVPDMDGLIQQNNRRKVGTGARMMYIRGVAKTCDVLIGRLVQIQMPKTAGGANMGLYRVYKVVHVLDEAGHYHCEFEALPSDLKYIPVRKVSAPVVNPLECEVWRNIDPLGLGRVQVKFPFDERPCDAWIPQMTPDAGGNGAGLGPASRGYSYVSEVGDSVLVSFLDDQLASPFTMGSMFHGGNAAHLGGGKGNHIKTITDKSRGQILMNTDELGDWGITIHDRNGNSIHLDTKGKNITITAPETMTLNSRNMKINVLENMDVAVGKNKNQVVGEDYTHTSKNKFQTIAEQKKEDVGKEYIQTSGEADIQTLKGDLKLRGTKLAVFQGGKDVKVSKA